MKKASNTVEKKLFRVQDVFEKIRTSKAAS